MSLNVKHTITITPTAVTRDGQPLATQGMGSEMLTALYRAHVGDYPKFFKMDALCRLGFIASELLLQAEGPQPAMRDDRAIVLASSCGSLCDDTHYQATIDNVDEFYPSPAVFVYTLSNIVTGEIAIRNHYLAETACYILPRHDRDTLMRIVEDTLALGEARSALCGWVDCRSDNDFEASIAIVDINHDNSQQP